MAKLGRRSRIPRFRSEAAEARFWDTHDSTAFLDELTPVKVTFARPKPIAARKGLGCGSLIRLWLTERLLEEQRTTRS